MPMADFVSHLIERAQAGKRRRIVLPETGEPRVLAAAAKAAHDEIAECVLVGNEEEIRARAQDAGITLPSQIAFAPPAPSARDLRRLLALRAHKGLDESGARLMLQSPIAAAALMTRSGEADGLVAGAATPSPEVLRPILQIVGPAADSSLVSSFFFMCYPGGALVFADCALNVAPTPPQLAEIAMQAAASAQAFGIEPKIALLSYATGESGAGEKAEAAREAAKIIKARAPHLPAEGPMQYDAAVVPEVARRKAPDSRIAGGANVLIFPDLAAGNIVYKAAQHAAAIPAVGPILQGLRRPANDLSRGASVEDIYLTIAVTALQAAQKEID